MRAKTLQFLLLLLSIGVLFTSCDDDDPVLENSLLTFSFTQNFDGDAVSASDFNQPKFYNEKGDTLSITRLRYLISDIRLYKTDGDSIVIDGYQLVDVTNGTGLTFAPTDEIPQGTYTGISFIFGFDSIDNVDEAYPDLNLANWNWPAMLGGGYHFMQMEGMFLDDGDTSLYAYHNGTAKPDPMVMEFEQNYFKADLAGLALNKTNADIEIQMDIAEWYKNPHLWDLETLNMMLMPNYNAQKMMQANGKSVFSLGEVTQTD